MQLVRTTAHRPKFYSFFLLIKKTFNDNGYELYDKFKYYLHFFLNAFTI